MRVRRVGSQPHTSLEGAVAKAEMIPQQVASLRFPGISGELVVTVSLGVACFREGEGVDNLLARADDCLYKAKRGGRNRVEAETVMN